MEIGPLSIEVGTMRVKRHGRRFPDGLHIWLGRYGVHLFWHYSPYMGRITFDREDSP